MMQRQDESIGAIWFVVVIAAALAVFWPALSGPFIFDDIPNLDDLGEKGGIDNFGNLLGFVFGGHTPLGRPVSLLSFVLNARDWPALAWPFKLTNLLFHVLNGILVLLLTRRLSRLAGHTEKTGLYVALGVMTIWLLHPVHISTMFLVVQRMTELMALFTLAGLIAYLKGRCDPNLDAQARYWWMTGAVCLGGGLAVLSKENGILICLYILVLEATLLRHVPAPAVSLEWSARLWHYWRAVFLWLPLTALLAYFALDWDSIMKTYDQRRTFTLTERLLTNPRALVDYVSHLFLPRGSSASVLNDTMTASKGLLTPPWTLGALLLVAASLTAGIAARRRYPLFAFGVLWFFAGHVLESSFVPLELYFLHRNYLPALGPIFALVCAIPNIPSRRSMVVVTTAAVAFVSAEIYVSRAESTIWSDEQLMAKTWVERHPDSYRARQFAAQTFGQSSQIEKALKHLKYNHRAHPNRPGAQLQVIQFECYVGSATPEQVRDALPHLRTGQYDTIAPTALRHLTRLVREDKCPELTLDHVDLLIGALLENPKFQRSSTGSKRLYWRRAILELSRDNLDEALRAADKAYDIEPDYNIPMTQASWLLSVGRLDEAMQHAKQALETPPRAFGASHEEEVRRLMEAIRSEQT